MAETHVLFALKAKYARLSGAIAAGHDRADDLAHVAAVIHMFNPAEDLSAIRPIRPYPESRDRWRRPALALLREANEPMTARDIAKRLLAAQGLPMTFKNLQRIECSMHVILDRLGYIGVVREPGRPKRWRVGT